jgi:hypothetical protein
MLLLNSVNEKNYDNINLILNDYSYFLFTFDLVALQKSITTMSEGVSRTVNEQLAATKDSVNNHLQHVLRNDVI